MLPTPPTGARSVASPLAYRAPEQLEARPPGPASDQFSFCVALYEGLYGRLPFAETTSEPHIEAIKRGKVPPPPAN